MKPIVACGSSKEGNLFKNHFGSAPYFRLYEINSLGFEFIEEIKNIALENTESRESDDEIKAKKISSLLKAKSVNVLLAHQMGPQVEKITDNFVPIISNELDIEATLSSVKEKLYLVEREWRKGENREYLVLEDV